MAVGFMSAAVERRRRAVWFACRARVLQVAEPMSQQKIFLASVFDDVLRQPILIRCSGLIWRPEQIDRGGRAIEDVCRDLIRESHAFVALLDWRSGHELAFADVKTPVTVLEIELIQALFQRMPTFIFALPRFRENERLRGLVELTERWRLAEVWYLGRGETRSGLLDDDPLPHIQSIAERGYRYRLRRWRSTLASRFCRYENLDMEFLNLGFDQFRDPFDANETATLIETAAGTKDHASRLTMLWAAMRKLCSVPYNDERHVCWRHLWETALGEWIRSAAWYGLHDDSPIGLLAAVNSQIRIRSPVSTGLIREASPPHFHGSHGARASALYSLARRCWNPLQRWRLLGLALQDVETAIAANPEHLDGNLAIRGSVYRQRGRLLRAIRDHQEVVAFRIARGRGERGIGEALSELGWSYAWVFRLWRARQTMARATALMRGVGIDSPSTAGFFVRALRKYAVVQLLTFDIAGARRTLSEAKSLARTYLVKDQVRGIL